MDDRTFHKSWKYSKYTKVNHTTITLKLGYKKNTTGDILGGVFGDKNLFCYARERIYALPHVILLISARGGVGTRGCSL